MTNNLSVSTNCYVAGELEVNGITISTATLYVSENAKLTVNDAAIFINGEFVLEKGSTLLFRKDTEFRISSKISMYNGSTLQSSKKLTIATTVRGEGRITIKATDFTLAGSGSIIGFNAGDFNNPGTPPNYSTNSQSVYSGGCHTGCWALELDGFEPIGLYDQPLKGKYIYGSVINPTSQGSNGAQDTRGLGTFGRGGGAVLVEVTNELHLLGRINVSGETMNRASQYGGGGAGGSILIKTHKLVSLALNVLSAKGGESGRDAIYNTSGSGGRIALHCYEDLTGVDYMNDARIDGAPTYFDVSASQNTQGTVWVNCGKRMNTLYLPSTSSIDTMYSAVVVDASEFDKVIIRLVRMQSTFLVFRMGDNAANQPLLVGDLQLATSSALSFIYPTGPGGNFVLGAKPVINNNCYSYNLKAACGYAVRKYMRIPPFWIVTARNLAMLTLPEYVELEPLGAFVTSAPLNGLKSVIVEGWSQFIVQTNSDIALESALVEAKGYFGVRYLGNQNNLFQIVISDFILDSAFQISAKRAIIKSTRAVLGKNSDLHAFFVVPGGGDVTTAGSLVGRVHGTNAIPSSLTTDIEYPRSPGVAFGPHTFPSAGSALEIDAGTLYILNKVKAAPLDMTFLFFGSYEISSSSGGSILVFSDDLFVNTDTYFITSCEVFTQPPNNHPPNSGGRIAIHIRKSSPTPRGQLLLPKYETAGILYPGLNCKGASGTTFLNGDGIERMLIVGSSSSAACDAATVIGLYKDLSVDSYVVYNGSPVEVVSQDNGVHEFKVTKHIDGRIKATYPAIVDLATANPFAFRSEWITNNIAFATQLNNEVAPSAADLTNLSSTIQSRRSETDDIKAESDQVMANISLCEYKIGLCQNSECQENSSSFVNSGKISIDITVYVINHSVYNSGNLEQLLDSFHRNIADSTKVPLNSIQVLFISQADGEIRLRADIKVNAASFRRAELIAMEEGLADLSPIHCTGFIST